MDGTLMRRALGGSVRAKLATLVGAAVAGLVVVGGFAYWVAATRAAAGWSFAAVAGMIFVVGAIVTRIGRHIARSIVEPLRTLAATADAIAAGDLERTVAVESDDDIGRLARSIARMVDAERALAVAASRIAAGETDVVVEVRGEHDRLGRAIERVQATAAALSQETVGLAEAARAGDLRRRGDTQRFEGGYRALVESVNRTLDALVAPIAEASKALERVAAHDLTVRVDGAYAGDFATIVTALNTAVGEMRRAVATIHENSGALATASKALSTGAARIGVNADRTSTQAGLVATTAGQVSENVQSVAAAIEEMGASIRAIAQSTSDSVRVADQAMAAAADTNAAVAKLGTSSSEIGDVVKVITGIAQQTNLLALNATIEAARAGDAGKGFAVVATEVKELARQTARATEDIGRRIDAIRTDSAEAARAIGHIGSIVTEISALQTSIAGAVEEQSATTREMERSVASAAQGTSAIASSIAEVAQAARETSDGARQGKLASTALTRMAEELREMVSQFNYGDAAEAMAEPEAPPITQVVPRGPDRRSPAARLN